MQALLMLGYSKEDLDEISRIVRENESFVALITGDIYGVQHYHLPSPLRNFTAMLDRNVYTRVAALVREQKIEAHALADHRWAAAIMAHCQIAEITFQYGSSLQEYASLKGGESAVADFQSFYRADNCDPQALIDFAVGRTDSLDLSSVEDLEPPVKVPAAASFEAPIYEFRANYIFALKIALLSFEKEAPEKLMLKFIDWMDEGFALGAGALQFANLYFSPARKKGMLKKRSLQDIRNVAWDLALVQGWRRCALEGARASEPVLLVTRDKVVKFVAQRLVASDFEEFRSHLIDQWLPLKNKGEMVFDRYIQLNDKVEQQGNKRRLPTDHELDSMTQDFEQRLIKLNAVKRF